MTQKKILVADDEKDIVELVAYNLEREGFAVLRAYDGQQGLGDGQTGQAGPRHPRPDDAGDVGDGGVPDDPGRPRDGGPAHHHADRQVGPRGQDPGAGDRGGRLPHQTLPCPGAHRPCPRGPAAVGAAPGRGSAGVLRFSGAPCRFQGLSGDAWMVDRSN